MKRFFIVEIFVIGAFVVGFFVGKSLNSDKSYDNYYNEAEALWREIQKADIPPVTLDDPDAKRVTKLRALYRKVFDKYPDSRWADDAIYQLASRIARTDEEAFALYRRLINNYPDSEWTDDSLYTIAIAYYRIAENIKQKQSFESADLYYDRAFALFEQLNRDYPGSSLGDESRFNQAMCYYGKGNWRRALDAFDALREEFRDSELIHSMVYYTGMIFTEQQEYKDARIEFQNVVDSGYPELAPLAQFGIGQTHFAETVYEQAIENYQKVIDKYPGTKAAEDSHFYMGWAYEKLKKYDESIMHLEEAIEKFPRNENTPNSQFYVAQIYYTKNDTDGAIDAYRKVADNETFDYDTRRAAQYWLGSILEKTGDSEGAIREYQKLLTSFPEPHRTHQHPSNNINENYIRKLRESGL
ncbi:MAG: tetratricopeptide repeat protein [Candidatus Poribacteria bacterium]|nr:tetratricopeptide repeat protein [Candidatus Poribacteria bacterium]